MFLVGFQTTEEAAADIFKVSVFNVLHRMQVGLVAKKVRLSVRPSVKLVNCDKMEERSVQIFIPYGRSFSLVL